MFPICGIYFLELSSQARNSINLISIQRIPFLLPADISFLTGSLLLFESSLLHHLNDTPKTSNPRKSWTLMFTWSLQQPKKPSLMNENILGIILLFHQILMFNPSALSTTLAKECGLRSGSLLLYVASIIQLLLFPCPRFLGYWRIQTIVVWTQSANVPFSTGFKTVYTFRRRRI